MVRLRGMLFYQRMQEIEFDKRVICMKKDHSLKLVIILREWSLL